MVQFRNVFFTTELRVANKAFVGLQKIEMLRNLFEYRKNLFQIPLGYVLLGRQPFRFVPYLATFFPVSLVTWISMHCITCMLTLVVRGQFCTVQTLDWSCEELRGRAIREKYWSVSVAMAKGLTFCPK